MTDPSIENRGCYCSAGLECILNIIRALRMGSCLSAESRSPMATSPSSPGWGPRRRKTSKKKSASRNSSFDYRREDPALHRIPGRIFLNGSTEVASLFTQQGKKGTNQDAMIVWEVTTYLSPLLQYQFHCFLCFVCLLSLLFILIYIFATSKWILNHLEIYIFIYLFA